MAPTDYDSPDTVSPAEAASAVALPVRLSTDPANSFSRRAASPAGHTNDVAHRPSPLTLPPTRLFEYEGHSSDASNVSSPVPVPNDAADAADAGDLPDAPDTSERKRSYPFSADSDPRTSDDDDEMHSEMRMIAYRPNPEHGEGEPGSADDAPGDTICVCAKVPKIPRPRNAFILYRQFFQAKVAAENPGLANPQISKRIGEMWRALDAKSNAYWKNQAEREKVHHRKMYPNYRYQPDRGKREARRASTTAMLGAGGPGGAADTADTNRCQRCGGRNLARLPSGRVGPKSASTPKPLSFAQGLEHSLTLRRPSGIQSAFPDNAPDRDAAFPSPGLPLPQQARANEAYDQDQKRRRFDTGGAYTTHYEASANANSTPMPASTPYRLSHRGHQTTSSSPHMQHTNAQHAQHAPPSATLPPSSPWTGASGVYSFRQPGTPHPTLINTGRLPPIQGPSYGFGYSQSAVASPMSARPPTGALRRDSYQPPSGEYAGESLRLPPLMTNIGTPASAAQQQQHHAQQIHQIQQRQKEVQLQQQLQQQQQIQQLQQQHLQYQRNDSDARAKASQEVVAGPATQVSLRRISDMYASSRNQGQNQNQGAGPTHAGTVEELVRGLPYLSKLQYLRSLNPPQPTTTRRGPIIAIEGQCAHTMDAVGRAVADALRDSGEVRLGVWSTTDGRLVPGKKLSTDSGVSVGSISSIDSIDTDTHPDAHHAVAAPTSPFGSDSSIAEYQSLILSWRVKSRAILRHITTHEPSEGTSKTGARAGTVSPPYGKDEHKSKVTAPPSPAMSSATQPSHRGSLSPASAGDSGDVGDAGAMDVDASDKHGGDPNTSLIPVALITDGHTLSLSDKFALSIPIEDSYRPIDHWEWMAMMWRATAAPDLVVYVDTDDTGGAGGTGGAVHAVDTTAQDGVMVVHCAAGDKDALDKKTVRRLTFEVTEWVHSFYSGN